MKLAKTDAIDAAGLNAFGAALKPRADTLPADWEPELSDLVSRREELVTARAMQKAQLQQLSLPSLPSLIEQAKALISVTSWAAE